MPPTDALTVAQFHALLPHYPQRRRVSSIHVHHSGTPDQLEWRGATSLRAMRTHHQQACGFVDLAQHVTIDPGGGIWLGRDWNLPPASSVGLDPVTGRAANGTADEGPLMVVLVGDFDTGRDRLDGAQREALIAVLSALCVWAGLPVTAILAHAQLQTGTSCPGRGLYDLPTGGTRWNRLLSDAQAALNRLVLPVVHAGAPPAGIRAIVDAARASARSIAHRMVNEGAMPEDATAAEAILRASTVVDTRPSVARGAVDPRYAALDPHVINTSHGLLFDDRVRWSLRTGGRFTSTPRDIDDIVLGRPGLEAYVAKQVAAKQPVRVMIHAHGGLVDETGALEYALAHHAWWMANGVYPIFMIWESGLLETLLGTGRGPGRFLTNVTDGLLEASLGPAAAFTWERMKANAARCSSLTWTRDVAAERLTNDGEASSPLGGARVFARALARKLRELRTQLPDTSIELHAVGHSAGAIFHAHFLPALLDECASAHLPTQQISTLSLLAPAVTIGLFEDAVAPLLVPDGEGPAPIPDCAIFTMNDDRERRDSVALLYRKSLLYFVRNACEPTREPLLGLEVSLRTRGLQPDASHPAFAGRVTLGAAQVAVHFATARLTGGGTRRPQPNPLTTATGHAEFDEDAATMTSVAARVLGLPLTIGAALPAIPAAYEVEVDENAVTKARQSGLGDIDATWGGAGPGTIFVAGQRPAAPSAQSGGSPSRLVSRPRPAHALCIGIDAYPTAPLRGCVADARAWEAALSSRGFTTSLLLESDATLEGMEAAIRRLLESTPDGGHALVQFAGHGTQLPDADGDESDGFDEAFVPIDHQAAGGLLDDELYDLLLPHADRVCITLLFDCCHSGTASRVAPPAVMARSPDDVRARLLAADARTIAAQAARDRRRGSSHAARARLRRTASATVPWIHIAGALDRQYAFEAGGRGAFSLDALSLLSDAMDGGWSAAQFVERVRPLVAARGRDQTPFLMPTTSVRLAEPLFP